jgi:hypothetical protein
MGFFPCYVRLEAFRCLSEGLKHSYDNWKMWQNYLYVAVVRAPLAMYCAGPHVTHSLAP